jgi:hypothetical protein
LRSFFSLTIINEKEALMVIQLRLIFILFFLFSLLIVNLVIAQDASNLLDGKTFIGLNGEKGKDLHPDENEELVFENGRFISTSCYKYNFAGAPYTAKKVGDNIQFEAVTISPTHGKIVWKGIVHGDVAEATFVWTKERWYWDTHREYWFKGSLKK